MNAQLTGPEGQSRTTIRRIFTATLVMGVSGSGKTSLLETFARYLWEAHKRILLLYSWDGGAIPTNIQKAMHQGLIRFWRVRTRSAPGLALESLYLATKGYWPKLIDPQTGETTIAVPLVAPVTTKYTVTCPKGHPLLTVPFTNLIVPTYCTPCKELIGEGIWQITVEEKRTKGLELIGGVAYDGLTSMTNVVMDHMDAARGAGQIGGEKSSFGGVVESGSIKFGGNNRADIGFAQTRGQQFVNNSLSIPNLVEGPVFTALSTEGSDKGGLTIVGADLPGQAALTQVPQWFGNIVEADKTIDAQGKRHFALRLRPFTDTQGRQHLLKTSSSPGGLPDFLEDPPEDARRPFERFNLGLVFKLLDDDLAQAIGDSTPLSGPIADYGEPVVMESVVAAAASPTADTSATAGSVVAPPQTQAPQTAPVVQPRSRRNAPPPPGSATPLGLPTTGAVPPSPAVVVNSSVPPPPGAKPPHRAPGT